MGSYDYRTIGDDRMSFYVFDDLRWQQNTAARRSAPDIYRYDTLAEAISKYKELPSHMKSAIGIHRSATSELDIVHRCGDEPVLVTDYMGLPAWRHDDAVERVVGQVCATLNIEWQLDRHLLGATVGIPSSQLYMSKLALPDSYLDYLGRKLFPQPPTGAGIQDPYSAINEVFVEGKGWIGLREAPAQGISFENPELLKVSRFNVRCRDMWGAIHNVDVSPLDLSILQEGYKLQHSSGTEFDRVLDVLVSDLDKFSRDADPYEYMDQASEHDANLAATRNQLLKGDTGAVKAYLSDFLSEAHPEELSVAASRLLARVKNLDGLDRKPALSQQMESAEKRKAGSLHATPAPEQER